MPAKICVILTLMASLTRIGAGETGHLVPIGANFDKKAPYAKTYARLCEKTYFPESNWIIRYLCSDGTETGLSVIRKKDGTFWVAAAQTRPSLFSVVAFAFGAKFDLKSGLETIDTKRARAEIPPNVANAVHTCWILLLSDVRPYKYEGPPDFYSNEVILFAKTENGKTLSGKFPPEGSKYNNLLAVEDLAFDLIRVCLDPQNRKTLFDRIERRARTISDAGNKQRRTGVKRH